MTFSDIIQIALAKIKQTKANLTYLLGADDAGKTTLAKELANQLVLENKRVAIIDADPGQSSRLPLTLSLNYASKQFREISELKLIDWGFIPSYNLMNCFERYIKFVEDWVRRAKEEIDCCFVDSNGDIRKWLKLREIEILHPDLVIALQRKSELEPILRSLRNPILRLPVPEEVKRKSAKQRKEIRNEKLKLYFKDSSRQIINCEVSSDFTHRIVGLFGQGMFLGLGIATGRDADRLKVMTPLSAKADKVEFSSVRLDRRL